MSTYTLFKADEGFERNGIELDLGGAGKFKIARAGGSNTNFERKMKAITKPYRRAIQTGSIDSKTADRLLAQAYAEAVVLSWEGVTGPDGVVLPFTVENCVKLFIDLPDLFKEIKAAAEDAALFRAEVLEADAGNS